MSLTVTDLFAGAGGSSTGMLSVPGVHVHMAANHWQLAMDVHEANHPDTLHDCADLSQVNPRRYPRTDILWASPECTNHSDASGKRRNNGQADLFGDVLPDEAEERSRATMWDVPRFAEAHRYQAVIVENVVQAAQWLPFDAWLMAMHSLGYKHHIVYLNSMHAQAAGLPAPQSRDRMYIVFWRKGNKRPDLERWTSPRAYCPACDEVVQAMQAFKHPTRRWGRYRQQYDYRCPNKACRHEIVEPGWLPAATAIDWSIPGSRIGDRKRPLAKRTRERIAAGIARHWHPQPEAFMAQLRGTSAAQLRNSSRSIHEPLGTFTASGQHHAPLTPYNGASQFASSVAEAMGTLTTADRFALITRHYSTAEGADPSGLTTPITETMRTLTTTAQQSIITPGDLAAADAQVDDALFRMLTPAEVAAGMAFPADYHWEGNNRERVKLAGNAVTPPAARDLMAAVAESLVGNVEGLVAA